MVWEGPGAADCSVSSSQYECVALAGAPPNLTYLIPHIMNMFKKLDFRGLADRGIRGDFRIKFLRTP